MDTADFKCCLEMETVASATDTPQVLALSLLESVLRILMRTDGMTFPSFITNQNNSGIPGYITVALNDKMGDFTFAAYTAGHEPIYATSADYNNDGNLDLVTGNTVDGTLSIFLVAAMADSSPNKSFRSAAASKALSQRTSTTTPQSISSYPLLATLL